MLLSIDRVLQLLAEGKSLDKIAELAHCSVPNVVEVIKEAGEIINRDEKPAARKKIMIKRSAETDGADEPGVPPDDEASGNIFTGAELSTIPLNSSLTMYIDGASSGNPGPAGIGILIVDQDGRQVGKISAYIGKRTNNFPEYTALIRALKIARYFTTRVLKI